MEYRFFLANEPKRRKGRYHHFVFDYIEKYGWSKNHDFVHPEFGVLYEQDKEYHHECKLSVVGAMILRHRDERWDFDEEPYPEAVRRSWPEIKLLLSILCRESEHFEYLDPGIGFRGQQITVAQSVRAWNAVAQDEEEILDKLTRAKL